MLYIIKDFIGHSFYISEGSQHALSHITVIYITSLIKHFSTNYSTTQQYMANTQKSEKWKYLCLT